MHLNLPLIKVEDGKSEKYNFAVEMMKNFGSILSVTLLCVVMLAMQGAVWIDLCCAPHTSAPSLQTTVLSSSQTEAYFFSQTGIQKTSQAVQTSSQVEDCASHQEHVVTVSAHHAMTSASHVVASACCHATALAHRHVADSAYHHGAAGCSSMDNELASCCCDHQSSSTEDGCCFQQHSNLDWMLVSTSSLRLTTLSVPLIDVLSVSLPPAVMPFVAHTAYGNTGPPLYSPREYLALIQVLLI